ncbi:MAG: helix-turn-helix domain-containing protein [Parvibaculum sp.]|nr:helix-turn-helix domain-containing protein [Parvibaculum sp.]
MEQDFFHITHVARDDREPVLAGLPRPGPARRRRRRRRAVPPRLGRVEATLTLAVVARAWRLPLQDLKAPTRRRAPVALARQVAMYLTHVIFGVSLSEVGRLFGRDRTTAAHACRTIEDRRDDPDFDRLLDVLAQALESCGELEVRP